MAESNTGGEASRVDLSVPMLVASPHLCLVVVLVIDAAMDVSGKWCAVEGGNNFINNPRFGDRNEDQVGDINISPARPPSFFHATLPCIFIMKVRY